MSAQGLADVIDRFTDLVGRATAWLALGIALVMGSNVLLRYGFSIGSIWMQELEWHIMVPICLLGMSYALLKGEHVRVDVVFQYFSPKQQAAGRHHHGAARHDLLRARDLAVDALCLAVLEHR